MNTEEQLKKEIKKWMNKLQESLDSTKALGQKGVEFLTNIKAYQSDSLHFYEKKDYVRSFEALIWAWAYIEIGKDVGLLAGKQDLNK